MADLTRRIVAQIRRLIGNRRYARRVQVKLPFNVSLADSHVNPNGRRRLPSLSGRTLDMSKTGLALVVPAIRIEEHYLAGGNRKLRVKLEIPGGPIEMLVASVRYESLDELEGEDGYLIGVRIIEMSDEDRKRYDQYLRRVLRTSSGD
jgi:hypothetical protein